MRSAGQKSRVWQQAFDSQSVQRVQPPAGWLSAWARRAGDSVLLMQGHVVLVLQLSDPNHLVTLMIIYDLPPQIYISLEISEMPYPEVLALLVSPLFTAMHNRHS